MMSITSTGIKGKLPVSKGSEIEVSISKYGYGGNLFYRAFLEEDIPKSKKKKLSVRHLNPLSKEDYSPLLIKKYLHRLFRPVPPKDPFLGVDFEEGDEVDADHKGSWWSGCVVKVLGNRRFLVYIGDDVIEVDRKDLRPHLRWKDEEWFRFEKTQLIESEFSAGKSVEVRTEVEQLGDVWAPAIAIKENYDGNYDGTLLVKYKFLRGEDDECIKISVPYSKIRPPPSSPVGLTSYQLMEKVEALIESGWCRGVVSKTLSGNRYTVLLGENKQSSDFNYSNLRPFVEWKDGAWQTEEKEEETRNRESVNKRKREQPRVSGNGSEAAAIELSDVSVVEKHVVETPPVKDTTMVMPFAKKSPLWKVLESMEAFKAVPQRPHFSPLVECEEESREGDAIGAMVTFNSLIEKVNKIQVNDPISVIHRINECFLKLEKHGFNVTAPRSRIGKLLSIKESQTWASEELKVAEREMSEIDNERRKCEEDIEDVSNKIAELQRREVLLKKQKVTMDREIAWMHSRAAFLDRKVQNVEQEFGAIVSAPWN